MVGFVVEDILGHGGGVGPEEGVGVVYGDVLKGFCYGFLHFWNPFDDVIEAVDGGSAADGAGGG